MVMARRDLRYKGREYRLHTATSRDLGGESTTQTTQTTVATAERDKEFGIRFDDRVSFHANEHVESDSLPYT